ncbi:MAG: c-type cytochrome [Acidobacteria bacterium]|nr:c-type cytochrome [Acidobacteriota bacterium]
MFAYLQSIPAIRNKVPEPVPPPGAPVPPPGEAVPPPDAPAPLTALRTAPTHGDPVARGKYLVTAIGCGDCHTPMTMGPKGPAYVMSRMLSGYPSSSPVPANPALQGWGEFGALEPAFAGAWGVSFAANLTPDAETGLGAWTEQQFLDTLRNGRHQGRGRQLLPPMPWPAFGQKDDADLKAIFAYLRTVPAVRNKVPDPVAPAGK